MNNIFDLIICIIVVEAITELIIKSIIFSRIRNFFISRSTFFEYLLTCGYCFSFWVSFFLIMLLISYNRLPVLIDGVLNYLFIFFIMQRGSNMLHGAIDRYFDTRKDIRYNFDNSKM